MNTARDENALHQRVLGSLGHEVTAATTSDEVVHVMSGDIRPDLAIVSEFGPEWIEPLEAPGRHVYRIGCVPILSGRECRQAFDAGMDDVMSIRASAEEICGRVESLRRIRRWIRSMGDDFSVDRLHRLERLTGVRNLPELLCSEFSEMMGNDLSAFALERNPRLAVGAEIPLTMAGAEAELLVGVGIEACELTEFSTNLFGEEVGVEIICDAVREFANTAGGAVKRASIGDDQAFSMGLPHEVVVYRPPEDAKAWRLEGEGANLVVWYVARTDQPRMMAACSLREGMVLNKAVRTGAGAVLVPQGAVLTERTVARLLDMLGPNTLVEVARAS